MAAPTLTTNAGADILVITTGTEGNPVTWNDVWDWDDGGGSSGGDGDVPKDGGGTAKVNTFMTETVADAVYLVLKDIDIGDDVVPTYFKIQSGESIYMVGYSMVTKINAILHIGDLVGEHGSGSATLRMTSGDWVRAFALGGSIKIYSSLIQFDAEMLWFNGVGDYYIYNSIINGMGVKAVIFKAGNSLYLKKDFFTNLGVGFLQLRFTPDLFEQVHVHNAAVGIKGKDSTVIFDKPLVTAITFQDYVSDNSNITILDPEINVSVVKLGGAGYWIKEVYTFNLHIRDKDGVDLQSASVDCEYAHLVKGSDNKAYKCIQDHTAVDATHKPITGSDWASFWELFDAEVSPDPRKGGDWDTGFDYKSGEEEFSTQTTDADGNITEQTVQYKKWVGTSEVLEMRIHKITMSKANYETLVPDDVLFDKERDLEYELLPALAVGDVRNGTDFGESKTGTLPYACHIFGGIIVR